MFIDCYIYFYGNAHWKSHYLYNNVEIYEFIKSNLLLEAVDCIINFQFFERTSIVEKYENMCFDFKSINKNILYFLATTISERFNIRYFVKYQYILYIMLSKGKCNSHFHKLKR